MFYKKNFQIIYLYIIFIISFNALGQNQEKVETEEKKEFEIVRQVPHPKSCEGKPENEQKKCLSEYLKNYIAKYFDSSRYLDLLPGKYRYTAQFKINTKGFIKVTAIKGPSEEPKQDIVSLLENVPQMNPGILEDKPVEVLYALPINFVARKNKHNRKARRENKRLQKNN